MSRRKKNKGTEDFLRYADGSMGDKERNAFERRLQKDPFEAEAAEGFSILSPGEAEEDLKILKQRLQGHQKRRSHMPFLRIAAIAVILIASGLTFFIVNNKKDNTLLSESLVAEEQDTVFSIAAAESIEKDVTEQKSMREQSIASEEESEPVISGDKKMEYASREEDIISEKNLFVAEERLEDKALAAAEALAVAEAPARKEKSGPSKHRIEGTVISAEDSMPLPGASIVIKGTTKGVVSDVDGKFSFEVPSDTALKLMAHYIGMASKEFTAQADSNMLIALNEDNVSLDEVVVTGYGTSRKANSTGYVNEEESYDYTPPRPATGEKAFEKYIEENIQYPSVEEERRRQVVVIEVTILSDGTVGGKQVIRSPGKEFTREAIRLIDEGPSWTPATYNGVSQKDTVKIRIVFK